MAQIPKIAGHVRRCSFNLVPVPEDPLDTQGIMMSLHIIFWPLRSRLAIYVCTSVLCFLLTHGTRIDDIGVVVWIVQPNTVVWASTFFPACGCRGFFIEFIFIKIFLRNPNDFTIATPKRLVLAKCKSRIATFTCSGCASIFVPGRFQFLPLPALVTSPAIFVNQHKLACVVFFHLCSW